MPRVRLGSLALCTAASLGLGACGDLIGGSQQSPSAGPTAPAGDARVLIDWTIAGAPPSAASCAAVDHFGLALSSDFDVVEISPIPCTLTKFRYDMLPGGATTLQILAFGANGCQIAQSTPKSVTLSATLPATPTRLELPALTAAHCH